MRRSTFTILLLIAVAGLWQTNAFGGNPTFYALNVSANPPPNVSALAALEDTSTSMFLFWTSGGGTTSSYRIAYASGSTAPASCTTGSQVSEATVGSATYYTITGLTANTTYSFRVCASNSSSTYATGVTVTLKTSASQLVYRSMGYNQTSAKATGAANAMTITGGVATFASGLATNIGIGDAIQYSSANNATIDRIAFIHGRLSSTQFLVKTSTGGVPANLTSNTSWSLFRAYTSFNNAVAQSENTGINTNVRNFDASMNLTTFGGSGATFVVAAYADAVHNSTFTNIGSSWTTGANNKLIFMTPWDTTRHVGARQRHNGSWSTSYFYATVNDNSVLEVDISNVVIEGMQFQMTLTGVSEYIGPIMVGAAVVTPTNAVVEINNNILEAVNNSARALDVASIYISIPSNGLKFYATNNILYCKAGTGTSSNRECMRGISAAYTSNENAGVAWTAYLYNNTVVGSWYYGFDFANQGASKTVYAKNNIVQGALYEAYLAGTWGAGSGYNISNNGFGPGGTGEKLNTTVTFVNSAAKDFHLAVGDTAAKNSGTNLSTDLNYPITVDIDTVTRTGTWDIGADEY